MSFTDGVDDLRFGRKIKAINLVSGTPAQDQMAIIWSNALNAFILQVVSTVTDIGQLTGIGFASGQYPQWNGSKFIPVTISASMSEVQFLASQAALGNLIQIQANGATPAGSADLLSYTVPNGKTFTLYQAGISSNQSAVGTAINMILKNDVILVGSLTINVSSLGNYPNKGDQLIGNGVKLYHIQNGSGGVSPSVSGVLVGYIM